ncbi:type IV pilin [Methanolacinia paynteri]|uniref:type IV pilin n=1 Tax=Methanolacinia paynteri TaxID=230356 RepID=UPI00064F7E09|nr:type IV pilin [Methanolacinia paynteri]
MKKSEDSAVSEVVGVLLMLTITLLIAGLVVVAASGLNSSQTKPIKASIAVSDISDNYIVFDNTQGDSVPLERIMISLGVQESPGEGIQVYGSNDIQFESYSGDGTVVVGGRFKLISDYTNSLGWGSFVISSGEHLDYAVYDHRTNTLMSTGSILVP